MFIRAIEQEIAASLNDSLLAMTQKIMSFYRTYRPQVIEEIDNVAVREQLLSLLSKDVSKLPHAFLFTGPRGAGKTTAARIIAKLFNCQKRTKHGPCGTCEQCESIAQGRNLDVLEIDAASNRGIDEMRALRDAINLAPSSAAFKIYIIDEVHMLTTEAFNALLKTLEEPPAHAVFVLATTDPQKVPATIKSRCVGISFHRATHEELASALSRIVTAEKIPIDAAGILAITREVDGAFRDAVKLLEQVSFHKGKITEDVVRQMTQATEDTYRKKFLTALKTRNRAEALDLIRQCVKDGKDVKIFLVDVLHDLQDILILLASDKSSDGWEIDRVSEIITRLSGAYATIKLSPIVELPLEVAVVDLCADNIVSAPVQKEPVIESAKDHTHSTQTPAKSTTVAPSVTPPLSSDPETAPAPIGLLSLEKLREHWMDFIAELKPYNHSVAAVLRSARPASVEHGIVTIEAFYPFHKDKLSSSQTKDILVTVLKKLFGEKVKVEIVLGKK